jgi:AcrR family transcriptional regulator
VPPTDDRQRATARRVVAGAQQLTLERGLDGWTMDELASVVGVSRRTLFNHVPGKVEAVLALPLRHAKDDPATCAALDEFRRGGPSGRLLDDVIHLGAAIVAFPDEIDPELLRTTRAVLAREPRVARAEHEHFERAAADMTALVLQREGADFGADRARLAVRLLLTIFDASIEQLLEPGESRTLAQLFAAHLDAAARLFADQA